VSRPKYQCAGRGTTIASRSQDFDRVLMQHRVIVLQINAFDAAQAQPELFNFEAVYFYSDKVTSKEGII
jgi:hypothetical protein